jgi:hypothetical protein
MIKKILSVFVVWRVLILMLALAGIYLLPLRKTFTAYSQEFGRNFPYFVWIWGNFDGYHYMKVAQQGYNPARLPFFPFYPLSVRFMHLVFHFPFLISGLIVSHITFIISLIVLYQLLKIDKRQNLWLYFFATLIFFPTSYSYGAVYNDSLFLLLASLTLLFGRRKQWFYATLAGVLTTLTRLNGLALCFFVLAEYLFPLDEIYKNSFSVKKNIALIKKRLNPLQILKSKIFITILIPLTYFGYLLYIQLKFGDWRLIYKAMDVWRQNVPTVPLQVFWRYLKIILFYPQRDIIYLVALIELFFVIFYIAIIIYSFKKIRFSYWLFLIVSILIPATTGTFAGMPRYGLHMYPLYLSVAILLSKSNTIIRIIYFLISLLLMLAAITLCTRGYFIA